MNPFNIVIRRHGKPLVLSIHQKDRLGFIVLFDNALVGEIFLDDEGKTWGAISARELLKDGHKGYACNESADCEALMFDKELVNRIGREIFNTFNLAR